MLLLTKDGVCIVTCCRQPTASALPNWESRRYVTGAMVSACRRDWAQLRDSFQSCASRR